MLETGFVTRSEYQKHIRGEWRTIHDLWPHIRHYMTSYAQPGGFTQGSIAFADADGFLVEDNANLFWDDTNKRLGIGTSTPAVPFHIKFPDVVSVTSRLSAKLRPWRQWECIDGDWGYAFGIHANDKMFHIHYDSPAGDEVHGMIHIDGDNVRVGILEDNPVYPFDVGGNTRIQGTFRVTGTTVLVGGVQGDLDVTGLLTAAGGDFLVASGDALRVGTTALNQDVDFHLGLRVGADNWETYGFYWRYKGSGEGNDNTLQLWAQNQDGAHVKVYEIWQDGAITFSPDVTLGILNISTELRFYDNGNYVGFEAPALDADQIWVLPAADGDDGDTLVTDGAGNLSWAPGGAADEKVKVDVGAVAGYLGVAFNDGVLRTGAPLTYVDGGNFVTLGMDPSAIKLDDLGAPDDNTDLDFSTAKHGLVPKGTDVGHFLKDDGTWAAGGGGGAVIFTDLTDTPANYGGAADKIVKVNATPDALEFGADIEDLEDVDTLVGQAGKYAKVKVGDAGIEWAEVAGNGAAAGPVLIFDSRFDDLALGNIDGKGAYDFWGTWVNASGADCTAEIVADPGNGRMLRLDDQSAVNECHASLTMTPGLSAEILMGIVEWKVKINQFAASSRGYFNIQDKDIGATEQGAYFRGDSNDIYYRSSGGTTAKLVDAAVDTWYIVRTFFDRLGDYTVWWVDGAFEQNRIIMEDGDKFDKLVLSTRDIHSGNVFDIKYVKVWSLNHVQ